MSVKARYFNRKALLKKDPEKGYSIYLIKSFDLYHGYGWFVSVHLNVFDHGFGFHKTNKFTAVRMAFNALNMKPFSDINV